MDERGLGREACLKTLVEDELWFDDFGRDELGFLTLDENVFDDLGFDEDEGTKVPVICRLF